MVTTKAEGEEEEEEDGGEEEGEGTEERVSPDNLYRLRVVLSPPRSFLVWTPLAQHRDKIARFK